MVRVSRLDDKVGSRIELGECRSVIDNEVRNLGCEADRCAHIPEQSCCSAQATPKAPTVSTVCEEGGGGGWLSRHNTIKEMGRPHHLDM